MREFPLLILSPERVAFEGDVVSIVVPGQEGHLGVMAGHAPMLAALQIGEVSITKEGASRIYVAIGGGVLEVDRETVTLLADTAEEAGEIDVERAREAKERAEKRLAEKSKEVDSARAHAALMRAINRLRVAAKSGR